MSKIAGTVKIKERRSGVYPRLILDSFPVIARLALASRSNLPVCLCEADVVSRSNLPVCLCEPDVVSRSNLGDCHVSPAMTRDSEG